MPTTYHLKEQRLNSKIIYYFISQNNVRTVRSPALRSKKGRSSISMLPYPTPKDQYKQTDQLWITNSIYLQKTWREATLNLFFISQFYNCKSTQLDSCVENCSKLKYQHQKQDPSKRDYLQQQ